MKKVLKYSGHIILHSLFLLVSFFCPKNKKLWVFGAWKGENYTDNAKYLFEYLLEKHPYRKYVWITRNNEVIRLLRRRGYAVIKIGTCEWFLTMMRAAVAFETEGNADIGDYRPSRCKIIQLWHGFGGKNCKWNKRDIWIIDFFKKIVFDNREKSYWMVPSEYAIQSVNHNFFVERKQCFLTGSPRNDFILNTRKSKVIDKELASRPDCKKVIAYMPTHRNFGMDGNLQLTMEMCKKINLECKKRKYLFVFKPHFHEMKHYTDMKSNYSHIVIADSETEPGYVDLYSYLGCFDMLISDYSSVIYDFLCTQKPVILFPYDLEKFKDSDGVPEAYFDDPSGPICYTWNEIFAQMDALDTNDEWREARERNRKNMHIFNDGMNCERIYQTVLKLLGEKSHD